MSKPTGFVIESGNWNESLQKPKNDRDLEIKLSDLRSAVLKAYNLSYGSGEPITSEWLSRTISESFCRPTNENGLINQSKFLYVVNYAQYWLDNKSAGWKVKGQPMTAKAIAAYQTALNLLIEHKNDEKVLFKDADGAFIQGFADFLAGKKYAKSTIEKVIERVKFFLNRADAENLKVNPGYKERYYVPDEEEIDGIYLNEEEIQRIFDHDFSDNDYLDSVRDLFIINLRSGIRVSDLIYTLSPDCIKDGYIRLRTKKTKKAVVIPVHGDIEQILNKRLGNLPPKVTEAAYNKALKVIGKEVGFTEIVYGKLFDKDLGRKVAGNYPRWMLFSSHISRRSMSTNLDGKISDKAHQAIFGWSDATMRNRYNQKSGVEYADELKQLWNQ